MKYFFHFYIYCNNIFIYLTCQGFLKKCQIKIKNELFFNNLKFKSGIPKTVKRYNLELKQKEKRVFKLYLNN